MGGDHRLRLVVRAGLLGTRDLRRDDDNRAIDTAGDEAVAALVDLDPLTACQVPLDHGFDEGVKHRGTASRLDGACGWRGASLGDEQEKESDGDAHKGDHATRTEGVAAIALTSRTR